MNILIYNVHRDPDFRNALDSAFRDKIPLNGGKALECHVEAQGGGYLFEDVTAVDMEIIMKVLNTFKNKYHIYFKVVNFGFSLKFINITKDFKFQPLKKDELNEGLVTSLKDKLQQNPIANPKKKDKIQKMDLNSFIQKIKLTDEVSVKNDGRVRSLATVNGEKFLINGLTDGQFVEIHNGTLSTNVEAVKKALMSVPANSEQPKEHEVIPDAEPDSPTQESKE